MTFDDLASKCKCGVHLTVNGYRDYYETLSDKFEELDCCDDDWATEDKKRKIIEHDRIVELQFYPCTPIGFIRIITYSVEDALKQAEEYFNENI